jgi:hypothetical protein
MNSLAVASLRVRCVISLPSARPCCRGDPRKRGIGCTITKDEHRLLNAYADLDGWERYWAAGNGLIDSKTGEVFKLREAK